jgi:hypothetical protein
LQPEREPRNDKSRSFLCNCFTNFVSKPFTNKLNEVGILYGKDVWAMRKIVFAATKWLECFQRDLDWTAYLVQAYLHPKRKSDSSPDNSNLAAGSLYCWGPFIATSFNLLSCNPASVENRVQGIPVCCPFKVVFQNTTFKRATSIGSHCVGATT